VGGGVWLENLQLYKHIVAYFSWHCPVIVLLFLMLNGHLSRINKSLNAKSSSFPAEVSLEVVVFFHHHSVHHDRDASDQLWQK
jgi:hypothetical protein